MASGSKKQKVSEEFPVPIELKESDIRIKNWKVEGDSFIIKHGANSNTKIGDDDDDGRIKFVITGNYDEDIATVKKWAQIEFYYIANHEQHINKLVDCFSTLYKDGAAKSVAKIKANNKLELKQVEQQEEAKVKKLYIQKYYDKVSNNLYEAVIIAGRPYFVWQEWEVATGDPFVKLADKISLPDRTKPTMELLPPEKEMYLSKPYEYASEEELNEYLKFAASKTLDNFFQTQKTLASKYIDANPTHITMIAADAISTHFQDKLGQAHYDIFVGDNDTGKTTNLVYFQYEGYRAMLDVDITPANIYGFLGNFEEGQGIILEDEADDIHKRAEKMKIYKAGYNSGQKVTRTDITNFGRKTTSWNTFGFKAFTMEEAPDINLAKGFMDRSFVYHCTNGNPKYDIKEVTNPAGDKQYTDLLNELIFNRNLLFAFRLLHYQDPLPNIELSVKNREKQLCKPTLKLFQDSECQEEIGIALAEKIGEKRGIKRNTLESKILSVISTMIAENEANQAQRNIVDNNSQWLLIPWEANEIAISLLVENVRRDLDGEYKREKDKSFETDEHGTVSHDKIRRICVDKFGAESKRTNSIRYLKFDLDKLERAKSAYIFPEKVTILQKNVEESGSVGGDADEPFLEGTEVNENDSEDENNKTDSNNSIKKPEDIKEIEEKREEKADENKENTNVYPKNDQTASKATPQESYRIVEFNTIEDIIVSCMNGSDWFDMNHWKTRIMCLPLQHPYHGDEDQAEQVLYALIQEGKIEEIAPGKFRPTTAGEEGGAS